jgi:two-component system phosphate regulon sensor histidine kinase PhoR
LLSPQATTPPLVWVVDDSPLDLQHAQRAIAGVCDTRAFTDGSAVLEALATSHPPPPEVLVLDWVMPGVSGIDVVRFMRSEGKLPQVPVLLLTARGEPQQIVEGLSEGANDYLPKPYHDEELRARVSALVRTSRLLDRALKAEESVRVLLANAPDALVVVDAQGRVTFANEEAVALFGEDAESLRGRPVEALVPDLTRRNISIGPGTGLMPLPDVTVGDRILSPSVRVLPTDTAARTTIALRDVTERRRAEARRVDFYSVMAHDLRSPLNAMLMRIHALMAGRRGPLPAEVLADMRKLEASSRSMAKMITDFLDLARFEGTGYKIARERVDLGALATKIVEELRPVARASGLALDWDEPPPAAAEVVGDGDRLSQVLANLVGNAIKFTPEGGRVAVAVQDRRDTVEVTVSDTGVGIPPEMLPLLFNRFTQGTTPARNAGWGLGLMIVHDIVEAHGGRIDVRSEVGKGSAFTFRVPRASAAEDAAHYQ